MTPALLDRMRDLVQDDAGGRGLRTNPQCNLVTETLGDFRAACLGLASPGVRGLAIVTGFFIPTADPPAAETDGPLGAVFLARALVPLGVRVALVSDPFCIAALHAGLTACGLQDRVTVVALPSVADAELLGPDGYCRFFQEATAGLDLTHLLAIERVGPSHTLSSIGDQARAIFEAEVPAAERDRCHTMRGRDVTERMSPVHWLFEAARDRLGLATIGIGDGGNEIGMGKIGWEVIRANIPRGGLVACRVPTDHLLVCGVSNWGAYALAAGVYARRGVTPDRQLFDPDEERRILSVMVREGPLVDPVVGKPSATVDGLSWERYAAVLPRLRSLIGGPEM